MIIYILTLPSYNCFVSISLYEVKQICKKK